MIVGTTRNIQGPVSATLSAILFGISPVLCKVVLGEMSPVLLAGLLYLGSGVGLSFVLVRQRIHIVREVRNLSVSHRRKLFGAIVAGGIIAPLCLVYGIKLGSATEVSLLLNVETVATTIIAWAVFKEHVGGHVWFGKLLIVVAASIIVIRPTGALEFSASGILIVLACIFWGIDNNLTRDVDELPATALAAIKGYGAGTFNVILALFSGIGAISPGSVGGALIIGGLSYGASLVLFVGALRKIGSARSSTYFAIGPFVGVAASLILFREHPPLTFWFAAALMLLGVFSLYAETHKHLHVHDAIAHKHSHTHDHDEHHHHAHDDGSKSEPHDHYHVHEAIRHSHVHWPDTHHRHKH